MVKIKGNEIEEPSISDSFDRRAVKIANGIMATLKLLGIERDNVEIPMERNARLKAPASVEWYFEGRNLKYTYNLMPKFIENLYIVDKVLGLEVGKLLDEEISLEEFQREFSEDDDLGEQLVSAREVLGVGVEEKDFGVISKRYKDLAREYHPDVGGKHEEFLKINAAHKLIRKELT
ncbi:MAG: J domain-containing protein [Nanoarchaeota archaeon]|nr:J domain-containing protein [Nanoarchaeota archaeon]